MKKRVSLNRFIATCALAICIVSVTLLIVFDIVLINNYQKMRWSSQADRLADYADKCGEALREISHFVDDLYVNDRYFIELSGEWRERNEYSSAYNLDMNMRKEIRMEGGMKGYIALYQAGSRIRYFTDTDVISVDDMRIIKDAMYEFAYKTEKEGQWIFIEANEHVYGMWIRNRANASFCAIYSMQQLERQILETVTAADGIVYVWNEQLMETQPEDGAYADLPELVQNYEQVFQEARSNRRIYGQRIENTSLWLCMTVPVTFFTYLNIPQLCMLIFTVICILLMIYIYRYVRKGVIYPLQALISVMNSIRDGQWDAHMDFANRFEEIEKVNEALEVMVAEIQKQKLVSYEQTIEKQKAQMQYLQLQLKPHFYLNGLKTLNVFFMNGDARKAQDLVMRLSEHLRYLLQAERELVLLQAEIDYVKNYLQLQEDMTGRPFEVIWTIQENIRPWYVPTLCIQTFVENSMKYARLGSAGHALVIHIRINELDTDDGIFLDIQIQDNGAGYPEDVLAEIRETPAEGSRMVGINNIKRRCRLIYGEKADFCFYNDDGAVSEMILPEKERA